MNKKICYITYWFNTPLPEWWDIFITTFKQNSDVDLLILTDDITWESKKEYQAKNIKYKHFKQDDINEVIKNKLNLKFTPQINHHRKFSEIRPMYGLLFSDDLNGYDFWGWLDPDIMIGNIRKFINDGVLNKYDIISGKGRQIAGHHCILRNTDIVNNLFKYNNLYIDTLKTSWYEDFFEESTFTDICRINESDGKIKCLFRSYCAPYGDYVWESGNIKQLKEEAYCGEFYSIGDEYLYTHYMTFKGMGNIITDRTIHLKNAKKEYTPGGDISKIEISESDSSVKSLGDDFYYSRNQKAWLISVTEDYLDKAKYLIKSLNELMK